MKRTLGIAAALLVGSSAALWLLLEDSPRNATPTVTALVPSPQDLGVAQSDPTAAPSDRPPAEVRVPTAVASEPLTDDLAQAMARRAYDGFGLNLVDYLARQGLARADAEPIVAELMRKTVACAFDALREQALEQRVDFDHVLNALDAELYDADGPLLTALVDVGAVDRRAMPCSLTALAQAGIPPQAANALLPRQRR